MLVKFSAWFGSGHVMLYLLAFCKNTATFHVVDDTWPILIHSQSNLQQDLFNHSHVDGAKFTKEAVGLDPVAILKFIHPPMVRVVLRKEVHRLLFGEVN